MRRPRQLSTAASCELLHCWCIDNTDRQDSLKEKLLTARRSSYCTRCTGTPTPSSPTISVHVKTSASLPAFCSKSSFTGDRRRIRGPSPSRSVPSEVGKWLRPSDVCDKSFCIWRVRCSRQVVRAALDPYTPSTLKSPEASYSSVSWGTAAKVQPDENGAVSEINADIGGEDGWTLKMIGDLYNCDGSLVICFACLFKHLAVESLRGGLPFGST